MKKLLTLALFAVFSSAPLLPLENVDAQDRERLTNRATQNFRSAIRTSQKKYPKRSIRPVERVFMNNTVYRYEGNANQRHDEVSSPEIMFHLENRRVLTGHVYDR
ncbi:MAG: hypothetical protein P1U85_17260 [Verrucomicrobiales bacterium]|nr:hypothetical protein [Verrucomicrobiales bacterium]